MLVGKAAERLMSRVAAGVHEHVPEVVRSVRNAGSHTPLIGRLIGGEAPAAAEIGGTAVQRAVKKTVDVVKTGVPNVDPRIQVLEGFGELSNNFGAIARPATQPRNIAIVGINKTHQYGDRFLEGRLKEVGHSVQLLDLGKMSTGADGTLMYEGKALLNQPDMVVATQVAAHKGSPLMSALEESGVPVFRGVEELRISRDVARRHHSEKILNLMPGLDPSAIALHPALEGTEGFARLGRSIRPDGVVTPGEEFANKPLIAFIGTNRNIKFGRIRMADEFEARGYRTVQLSVKDIDVIDGRLYHEGKLLPRVDVVMPRGGASMTPEGLAVLDKVYAADIPMVNSPDSIRQMGSKVETSILLKQEPAIDQILTEVVATADDAARVAKHDVDGYVAKVENGTQGKGITFIPGDESEEIRKIALNSYLDTVHLFSPDERLVVQEWLQGPESKGMDRRMHLMSFLEDPHMGSMTRYAADGKAASNTHQGGTAELFEPPAALIREGQKIGRRFGAGHISLDWIQKGDKFYLLEANGSGGVEGIESYTKQNVAGNLVDGIIKGMEMNAFARNAPWKA